MKYLSKAFTTRFLLFIMTCLLLSCADIKESDIEPGRSFTKIYNNTMAEGSIYPMDIMEIPNGGYVVLSEVSERQVHLLRLDSMGEVVSENTFSEYLSPLQGIHKVNSDFYFFARNTSETLTAVKIDLEHINLTESLPLGISYPLSIGKTSDGFIAQSWNQEDKKTQITKISNSFQTAASKSFDIHEDMEAFISNHIFRKGQRLPFISGEIGNGHYFFNGYSNYNFNLMFLNNSLENMGNVAGYKTEKFITSICTVSSTDYAITSSEYEKNYLSPYTPVNLGAVYTLSDIKLGFIPEMSHDIPVIIKKIKVNAVDVILCAFTTKTKQIALNAYKVADGALLGKFIIGNTNPFEIGNFTFTKDEGLAVLAKTQVAGKFPRLSIIKFSKDQLNSMFSE